jgi:hypothetical protein
MTTQTMNILAVIIGPIIAVLITLWYQKYKEKQNTKHRVFLTLMAHRKSSPPSFALVEVLNTLDVVFADRTEVIHLWHEYYDLLYTKPPNFQLMGHKYLELLSAIAVDLGYKNLQQTDIDKFYIPQGHVDLFEWRGNIQKELLRVLQNTASFVVTKKEDGKT